MVFEGSLRPWLGSRATLKKRGMRVAAGHDPTSWDGARSNWTAYNLLGTTGIVKLLRVLAAVANDRGRGMGRSPAGTRVYLGSSIKGEANVIDWSDRKAFPVGSFWPEH